MSLLARENHWSPAESLGQPVAAFFFYAMEAERARWERLEDMRRAVCYPQMDDSGRQRLVEIIGDKTDGPGVFLPWQETISPEARARMAEAEREMEEARQSFIAAGFIKE